MSFEIALIPGLLQTPDYTRTLLAGTGLRSEDEVEAGMAARFCRQTVLEQRNPPTFLALIDELVLHRIVGGPDVMRRQLDHLVDCSQSTRVAALRVVPNGSSYAGTDGSFELIDLPTDQLVVFVEEAASNLFIEQPDEVDVYRRIIARLLDDALDEQASVECIKNVARRLELGLDAV